MARDMKLIKTSTRVAMSLIPMDVVFYKDEADKLYRLLKVPAISGSTYEALSMATCLSRYAPDIIEGETIEDYPKYIHIRVNGNNSGDVIGVYELQKNAENYKFWDITDEFNPYSAGKDVTPKEKISEIHRISKETESGKKPKPELDMEEHKRHIQNLERILERIERKHPDKKENNEEGLTPRTRNTPGNVAGLDLIDVGM